MNVLLRSMGSAIRQPKMVSQQSATAGGRRQLFGFALPNKIVFPASIPRVAQVM